MGGKKAMIGSILDGTRKQAGLTPAEWKQSPMFLETEILSNKLVGFIIGHPIIIAFQSLSKDLVKDYEGSRLQGPSGYCYHINEHSFKNVFPCFLQSYELY